MEQLSDAFEFVHRAMSEEMWTQNYQAIALQAGKVAKQYGNASFDLDLVNDQAQCVFSSRIRSSSASECRLLPQVQSVIQELKSTPDRRSILRFDSQLNRYVYAVPLYVGAVTKGYLYVSMDDPYNFYRGKVLSHSIKIFLPIVLCVLLIWVLWLVASKRWILKPYLTHLVRLEKKEALGKLAARVAHDIQSPLAALSSVVQNSKGLEPQQNLLLKSAASRIQSLADDLLIRYKNPEMVVNLNLP